MSADTKAMFQARNFTLPPDWMLSEPQELVKIYAA